MDRVIYIILVFAGCLLFFRYLLPILLVLFLVYMCYSFFKSMFQKPQQEDYYEETVYNPHQNTEADIIDVDYEIIDEQ